MQIYVGFVLVVYVIDFVIEMFNKIVGDWMQIELFYVDQLVLIGELFCVFQCGIIDVVQLDDDLMVLLIDVIVFGGYFFFVLCYLLDVFVLFN